MEKRGHWWDLFKSQYSIQYTVTSRHTWVGRTSAGNVPSQPPMITVMALTCG